MKIFWVLLGAVLTRVGKARPFTESCSKPLLKAGVTPLLETILEGFPNKGFDTFYNSVNYMAEMIEEYFGDGSKWA